MSWTEQTETAAVEEWEREDGWATIRLRRRGEGSWLVRLDRLTQAPEGSLYREQRLDTRAAAADLVVEWQETYDVPDASAEHGGSEENNGEEAGTDTDADADA